MAVSTQYLGDRGLITGNLGFRDGFARDCLLQRRVNCEPDFRRRNLDIAGVRRYGASGYGGWCARQGRCSTTRICTTGAFGVETTKISHGRSIVHFIFFLLCFYFGFIRKAKGLKRKRM